LNDLINEAAKQKVALELNANPHRLDLDWRYLRQAKEKGVKISINPDAHRAEGISDLRYGIGIARKGWLTPFDVLNCLNHEEILQFSRQRRNPV
jgi:DNA polymerase (family 10)